MSGARVGSILTAIAFALLVAVVAGCSDGSLPPPCTAATCPCSGDAQCSGATPRCDPATHRCVACLPEGPTQADSCPNGQHCVLQPSGSACVPLAVCVTSADCAQPDAGAVSCCAGRCANTDVDVSHCGACGTVCSAAPNSTAACLGGACGIGACAAGFADCNHSVVDGCEVDTQRDAAQCGGCGMACAHGPNQTTSCVVGACQPACVTGFSHCSMNPADGCEVDSAADVTNCGRCGNACTSANAASVCVAGVCGLGACDAGFADCNGISGDGCEVSTLTDVANCGACNRACSLPNATPACVMGQCVIELCTKGFGNCNGLAADGCEVDLLTDVQNCAACGLACVLPNASAACVGGACAVAKCDAGRADCDGNPFTGCEARLQTDVLNCGKCGNACGMNTPVCAGGVCQDVKLVFVSSANYTGNLGGLAGADTKCSALAAAAGLPGTYKAWLGDSHTLTTARLTHAAVPYCRVDGAVVAKNWDGLLQQAGPPWNPPMLQNPINLTEAGGPAPKPNTVCGDPTDVWSSTSIDGLGNYPTCDDWTTDNGCPGEANFGSYSDVGGAWVHLCSANACDKPGCASLAPIFCFQQ